MNLQVSQTSDSITANWGLPYEGATMLFRVELRDPESRRRIGPPRLIEETTFTYHGLEPSTRYEVEIVHMGTVIRAARQIVTTTAAPTGQAGARSPVGPGLSPFALPPPSFSWPVQPGASHEMTADPWIWRGPDLGPRYHIGLDIGTPVGVPVHAAEAGMLRVANERRANTGYVLYCPDRGPLSLRPPLHQQIEYSTESSRSIDGRLACMYIVSAASGRTALIFHDDGQHVTKYSHLASFSDKIQRSLAVDWRAPIRVAEGEQIGLSGASADRDEYGTDPHLHFEIRYLYGTVSLDWYEDEQSFAFCDPLEILKQSVQRPNYGTVTRGYCGWHEQRYMDTVRDPEEYLPPLPPESDKPAGERAFELASVDAVGSASSPALRLSLSVSIERPAFYDYWDYEWVAPEENGTARVLLPGLQRSRPNLTGFRILQDDGCREPDGTGALDDRNLLTQDVDRHQVSFRVNSGGSCTLAVASRNELNQFGTPGLGQRDSIPGFPSEVTPRNIQLQARSIRGTGTAAGTLKTFDMHVYEFIALEDDSVSFNAVPGTSRDLVLEIWQGERLLAEGDDPSLEPFQTETLLWTAPSGGGRFFLVVRGGYLGAVTSPAEGSYTLTYSVPGTASGDYCQAPGPGPRSVTPGGRSADQCPSAPANPTVSRLTHETARLDWDPGAAGTTYEVRAITGIDCQAGLTAATVLPTTTTTSHWFTMLEPGTDYRFCVRTTRTAGVAPNQFKVHSAWASVDQTTPLELEIASATASSNYCVRSTGIVLVAWTLKGGTLPYTVAGETSRNTFGTATLDCPSNAGQSSVSLFATDGGRPPQNSSVTIPITAVEPLSFQLTTTSFSCETDGSIMVLWELSGGSGSYTVVVEDEGGVAATGDGSAAYDCPDAAGTYTWTLTATDRNVPDLNEDASLTLVVTDPEPEPLEITSATTTWQHCVKGAGRVPVDWTAVGGEPPYSTNGVTVDADTVTLLCPGTVGPGAMTLVVTDDGSPASSATADVAITATEALSFELDDSALSCETDGTITIDWTLSGGRADYTVTLPSGSTVSASAGTGSTSYECASTAGTRTLTFSVVDASNPMQSDSDSLTITISEAEPDPIMIESAQTTWRHCVAGEDSAPVDWVVSGGVPPYTLNGQAFGASVSSGTVYVDCPATTGSHTYCCSSPTTPMLLTTLSNWSRSRSQARCCSNSMTPR